MGTTARVLKALAGKPGTLVQLATRLGIHTSTLYVTLERRRLSGHVTRERKPVPGGRASYVYKLTPYGRANLSWWTEQ